MMKYGETCYGRHTKTFSKGTWEMPQSRGTAFPRQQKKGRGGTNNDKNKHCIGNHRRTYNKHELQGSQIKYVMVSLGNKEHSITNITKTCLYNFDPLKPHFYIAKLGFTGVYIIFLLKNIDCEYSLEPPRQGGSNEYPQYMFWAEIWKILEFLSKNFQFLEVKFSIYLNWRVFVMRIITGVSV